MYSEWTEEEEGLFYEKRNRKCIDEFVTITPLRLTIYPIDTGLQLRIAYMGCKALMVQNRRGGSI